jgi:hypothetical protein
VRADARIEIKTSRSDTCSTCAAIARVPGGARSSPRCRAVPVLR